MTILTSANGSLPLTLRKGETLVIRNYSGTETVTGSTVAREDVSSTSGAGAIAYGPQSAAASLVLSSSGSLDYQVVSGDVTPAVNVLVGSDNQLVTPDGDVVGGGVVVRVVDLSGDGDVLGASLADGWVADSWQWYRKSSTGFESAITGATSQTYARTPADFGFSVFPRANGLRYSPAAQVGQAAPVVGGAQIGATGGTGTIYEGFTLSWGDDFRGLNILAPHIPRGRWWTTRTYLSGSRGSDTVLGTMYDMDPYHTGHEDSNMGVPVGASNMRVTDSVISLQARKATAAEQAHMISARNEVGAMLSGAGAAHWYPAAAGTGDIIFEARVRFSTGNPAGWHPTFWLQSLNPVYAFESDEFDWEGSSTAAYLNKNTWTAGGVTTDTAGSPFAHDGQFHVITFILNTTNVRLYIDGSLYATGAWNGNFKTKPQYPILSSHVYNGTYKGDTYSAAAWNADADGASMDYDWVRVWRRSANAHYYPLVSVPDYSVAFGQSLVITLPSAANLWGDGTVTEYLQAVYNEENEPGVGHTEVYTQFPPGVTYNSGTRELTINIASGNTGRINFVLSSWKTAGTTGEPLRFAVNVGPSVNLVAMRFVVGETVNFDLYRACDCGVLVTDGASRMKRISVTGLGASGLSYDDATGRLTGTWAGGSHTMVVAVTNSVGQTASTSVALTTTTATGYAYESWASDGVGWFDASDTKRMQLAGGAWVKKMANKRAGKGDLTGEGAARAVVANAQNGREVIAFTRNTASAARLVASASSELSQTFQGDDKPYTAICVYKPTDTNTGYIWSASDTVDTTDAQRIALVRRSGSASSARRAVTTAGTLDVNFGTGQASGSWRIVAIKFTGTTVSVWDTSTTAAVSAAAQDAASFNNELRFMIGASESAGASDPAIDTVCCAMDFAEMVVQSTARTDAEIQQAITDLATKWGITLS